jgi:hypothetical protein
VTTEDAKYADLSMGKETERQRDRETERQRDRETERQRDRETEEQRRDRGRKDKMLRGWIRSSRMARAYLPANAKVVTVLGSIPASSYISEDCGAEDKAVLNIVQYF